MATTTAMRMRMVISRSTCSNLLISLFYSCLCLIACLPTILGSHFSTGDENVFGMNLEACSTEGMAVTGLERDGRCAHLQFDSRSHPICVDLSTFPTFETAPDDEVEIYEDEQGENIDDDDDDDDDDESLDENHRQLSFFSFFRNKKKEQSKGPKENFFTLTGQPNWMQEPMPCTDDPQEQCPIQHWCVNERAFAFFIERVGGCHNVGNVVCSATNLAVLDAYQNALENSHGGEKAKAALKCLKTKCWI
ncbi:expressed unknown protein [Seminavis robusta]|uniref:Uncharacterized protein n=1 Tax=Seminavis robusta TaxID=568900 RepID=A0A9N8HEW1_9STRA|nr:expressed unknown protein [Seminavis robusta]|eukprot:Sro428_g140941.1  (249) ;mRNA; r:62180-62926